MGNSSHNQWWSKGRWGDNQIFCEAVEHDDKSYRGVWDNEFYPRNSSYSSILLCNLTIILSVSTMTWLVLKSLRMPFTSQMIGGVIVMGIIFSCRDEEYHTILPPTVIFILKTISSIGFLFQLFLSGLETNMTIIIRRMEMKPIFICVAGILTSVLFSLVAYFSTTDFNSNTNNLIPSPGISSLISIKAESFLLVTCNNLNDLGISNSDIGRLASSISLVVDVVMMTINFIIFVILPPITSNNKVEVRNAFIILGYFVVTFFFCRPLLLYIARLTPEGKKMTNTHFMYIFLIVLIVAGIGDLLDEMFGVFLFALSLPEHPLSSIFSEKLDAINTAVFFPLYCAMQGLETNIYSLSKRSFNLEFILILGYVGKFLGTTLSSRYYGIPLCNCLALSLIICSKGLLDVASLGIWREKKVLDMEEYTLAMFHFLIFTGALMPFTRNFYEPLSQYDSVFRLSVGESTHNNTFQTLACIHKEENSPGIIRLIEAFNPSRTRPIPLVALQLIPQTGRCTMPIMAAFDQVRSLAIFRTKLAYATRIVEAFLNLERESRGYTRLKHYISMCNYESMHNDICCLAYERDISLIILPFHIHVQWTKVGKIVEDSSQMVREVNKMVVENAPCSVGMLLDRGDPHEGIADTSVYQVAIIFVGGPDDKEALAFSRLFGSHPKVKIAIIWLKSKIQDNNEALHHEMIMSFQSDKDIETMLTIKEVFVTDGSDTTNVLLAMNGVVDLVVVGRQHDPNCAPLRGLSLDGWYDYPELGILGNFLATPDFGFSVLVVQQEPKDPNEKEVRVNRSNFIA